MSDVTRAELDGRGAPEIVALDSRGAPEGWKDKTFRLRCFGGEERDRWDFWCAANSWNEDDAKAGRGRVNAFKIGTPLMGQLVALTLCDADGELLYDPKDPADVLACERLADPLLSWLFEHARRINGLGKEAQEDLRKNSVSAASEDTGSGSRPSSDTEASANASDG